ncbi:MAG: hypothetical protein M3142_04585, partial [Bacteroidota bacterium]|nr:hypothetical protein [Bacteroidota bacterium]
MLNLNLVYSNEFIRIEVNQNYGYLQTTWLQQPTSVCFREQLMRVVEVALNQNLSKALFDIRDR